MNGEYGLGLLAHNIHACHLLLENTKFYDTLNFKRLSK